MMKPYFGDVWLTRLLFQRMLAAIYMIAFFAVLRQFKPLLGERGLLPATIFLKQVHFSESPSIFYWRYSDRFLDGIAWVGISLSAIALSGLSEMGSLVLSVSLWLVLWVLYLSIVNIGQAFYSFGWESMLLEAGFFTAFLGSARIRPSVIPILILRWMLFRTELGAGLIKLRHDPCWRKLTCLFYHYETQPLPNPLSWYFHRLPEFLHRLSVLFSHFVQVIAPFGLFASQPVAAIAGGLIILHQLWLIVSGNYSWLNWLTVALGITALNDSTLRVVMSFAVPATVPPSTIFMGLLDVLAAATILLSIQPALNLWSKRQLMNHCYNPLRLVNAYGAFGNITQKRYEIVLEGTNDPVIVTQSRWQEYEFRGKPGNPRRVSPQIAPYHLRLDWLMWFLPFSVAVTSSGLTMAGYEIWFLRLIRKLLENDPATLKLLRHNPFQENPPRWIRALFYVYRYTTWREKKETGAWWKRELVGTYLAPVSLAYLRRNGTALATR